MMLRFPTGLRGYSRVRSWMLLCKEFAALFCEWHAGGMAGENEDGPPGGDLGSPEVRPVLGGHCVDAKPRSRCGRIFRPVWPQAVLSRPEWIGRAASSRTLG
jgi:hypothetical protein